MAPSCPSQSSDLSSSSPANTGRGRGRSISPTSDELRYKRMCFTLLEQQRQQGKRKRGDTKEATPTQLGRGIRKVVDLWADVGAIVLLADEHAAEKDSGISNNNDEDDNNNDDEERCERDAARRERRRASDSFAKFPQLIPNFLHKLDTTEPEELAKWYALLQRGANDARSDDVHKLMNKVGEWLNAFQPTPSPLIDCGNREGRGLQHDLCGMLLCPIEHNWDDLNVRAKVRTFEDGYELSTSSRALYSNYKGDPSKLEAGFLRSMLLVKTYMHIFTSPASAKGINIQETTDQENINPPTARQRVSLTNRKASRKSVAATLHMNNKVTPRTIAYAAIQLLFALSSAPQWTTSHQGLDLQACYYYIVDFFEDIDDDPFSQKVSQDLLKWWNRQIFPQPSGPQNTNSAANNRKKLAEQRAARKAANVLSLHND